MLSINIDVKNL